MGIFFSIEEGSNKLARPLMEFEADGVKSEEDEDYTLDEEEDEDNKEEDNSEERDDDEGTDEGENEEEADADEGPQPDPNNDDDYTLDDNGEGDNVEGDGEPEAQSDETPPDDGPQPDTSGDDDYDLEDEGEEGNDGGEDTEGEGNEEGDAPPDDGPQPDTSGDDDYDLEDDSGEGGGDNADDTSDTDDSSDDDMDSSDDGSEQDSKLKELEGELFDNLTPEQKQIKIDELKKCFQELHERCDKIIDMINDATAPDENISKVFEYVNDNMTNLKQYIYDYFTYTFDTRSYLENNAQYQKYIAILNSFNNILEELVKTRKEDDE